MTDCGQSFEYFTLVACESVHTDPMDNVVTTWSRVEGGEKISGMVDQLLQDFSLLHAEKSVPELVNVYKAISHLKEGYWKTQKLKEVQQLIEAVSGLWLEALVAGPYAVPGDSLFGDE